MDMKVANNGISNKIFIRNIFCPNNNSISWFVIENAICFMLLYNIFFKKLMSLSVFLMMSLEYDPFCGILWLS